MFELTTSVMISNENKIVIAVAIMILIEEKNPKVKRERSEEVEEIKRGGWCSLASSPNLIWKGTLLTMVFVLAKTLIKY